MRTSKAGIELIKKLEDEEWKVLEKYPNYSVSNKGRILGPRGIVKPYAQRWKSGYIKYRVGIYVGSPSRQIKFTLGYLVLLAFVGERPIGMHVCHNDGNPRNNELSNLRYGTAKDNQADRKKHGTDHYVCGEASGAHKLSEKQVVEIYKDNRTQSVIAKNYGISQPNVVAIKKKRSWKKVTDRIDEGSANQ